jgi:hypothetical protein
MEIEEKTAPPAVQAGDAVERAWFQLLGGAAFFTLGTKSPRAVYD